MLNSRTADIFDKYIVPKPKKKKKPKPESGAAPASGAPSKSRSSAIRPLPDSLVSAIASPDAEHPPKRKPQPLKRDFGTTVELINKYVQIKKDLAAVSRADEQVWTLFAVLPAF